MFGKCLGAPNPYNLSGKHSTPPMCNAVPCWLLNFGVRETLQYTSNLHASYEVFLYRSTPPISTGDLFERIPRVLENSRRLWLFLASFREFWRKVPGNFWETCWKKCRRPPTIYHTHKMLPILKWYFQGVVYELSEPKRAAKCIPPPGWHLRCSTWFCGGGARIVAFENVPEWQNALNL